MSFSAGLPRAAARVLNPLETSVNSPIKQSKLANFFSGWPRFGLPTDIELTSRYFGGAFLVAFPFLIIAVIALVLGLCFSFQRRRARKRNSDESYSSEGSASDGHEKGVVGALFFNAAFLLIALGCTATFTFYAGVLDVFDALNFGVDGVFGGGIALTRFVLILLDRVESGNSVLSALSGLLGDIGGVRESAATFLDMNTPLLEELRKILSISRRAGVAAFILILLFFVSLFVGVLLVFALSRRLRVGRRAGAWVLLMLFPMVNSWVALGVVSAVGALAGDACDMLGDYHKIVLDAAIGEVNYAANIDRDGNLIFDRGITCAKELVGNDVLDSLGSVVVDVLGSGFADGPIGSLFGGDGNGISSFSSSYFRKLQDCSHLVRFSGRSHQALCAPKGPMDSIFGIFLSLLLLSIVLTLMYFVSQYGAFDATAFIVPPVFRRTGDDGPVKLADHGGSGVLSGARAKGHATPRHSVDVEVGIPVDPRSSRS